MWRQTYVVSLLSAQCVVVRRGDRLGVYSERRQSPVAFVFDDRNPRALAHSFTNYTHPVSPPGRYSRPGTAFPKWRVPCRVKLPLSPPGLTRPNRHVRSASLPVRFLRRRLLLRSRYVPCHVPLPTGDMKRCCGMSVRPSVRRLYMSVCPVY